MRDSLAPPEPSDTELQALRQRPVIGPALATTGVSTPSVRRRTERRMVFMVALVIWFSDFCGGHERLLWTLNPTISSGCRILGAASGLDCRSTRQPRPRFMEENRPLFDCLVKGEADGVSLSPLGVRMQSGLRQTSWALPTFSRCRGPARPRPGRKRCGLSPPGIARRGFRDRVARRLGGRG